MTSGLRSFSTRKTACVLTLALPCALAMWAGVVGPAQTVIAAPRPEAVPRRWELELTPGQLRVATLDVGSGPRTYFYITYKVVNKSGADRWFAPSFEMDTGDGTIYRSGRNVPSDVVTKLIQISGNSELMDEVAIQGQLLQGPENAKEGIVVWPCTSLKPDYVNLYFAGFSGENKTVTRPDNGQTIVLRKQRCLGHPVSGELNPSSRTALSRNLDEWILRQ